MKKILIIQNPAAGRNNRKELGLILNKYLEKDGVSLETIDVDPSTPLRHQISERFEKGYSLVVAAGGDGTVSGVASVIAGSGIPLGIIPAGTGNLLARELGIPLKISRAAEVLAGGSREKVIDAMAIGDRVFLSNIGVGLSGHTIKNMSRSDKKIWGFLAYIGGAIKNLGRIRPQRFTVIADGEQMQINSPEISISNSGIINRMVIPHGPEIKIDDGALDLCYVRAGSISDYPELFLNLIRRRPHHTIIRRIQVRNMVKVDSERPADVQADGELIGKTPLTVKFLPGALRVIVPDE